MPLNVSFFPIYFLGHSVDPRLQSIFTMRTAAGSLSTLLYKYLKSVHNAREMTVGQNSENTGGASCEC